MSILVVLEVIAALCTIIEFAEHHWELFRSTLERYRHKYKVPSEDPEEVVSEKETAANPMAED